jgi:hypothetical protein
MTKYSRLIKTCIAIAVLTPLIASGGYLTNAELSDFNRQAALLETQMNAQVSQFPLDTELSTILNQFEQQLQAYNINKYKPSNPDFSCPGRSKHCRDKDITLMTEAVKRATVRVAECQQAQKPHTNPGPPPSTLNSGPIPLPAWAGWPTITNTIQMMNEGQFGVPNIPETPPPPPAPIISPPIL